MLKKLLFPFIICLGIAILFFFQWIWPGHVISAGESGVQFYHVYNNALYIDHAWSEGVLGVPTSYSVGGLYYLSSLAFIESLHVPGYIIQVALFAFFIFVSLVGVVLIICTLLPEIGEWFALAAAVFYLFNLISVVSIWNRLQYPFIMFYIFLPLAVWLFIKGIYTKNLWYAVGINGGIFLFAYAFSSIPVLELLWIVFGLFILFYGIAHTKKRAAIFFSIGFFVFLTVIWAAFNSFWILQFIKSLFGSTFTLQSAYSASGDVSTFTTISERLGSISYIFRLMHKDFFTDINSVWKGVYANPLMTLLTFLPGTLAFLPLIQKRKPKAVYFFLAFTILTIFLMKGSAGPFGRVFLFIFSHVRLLEAFRNPFEKFSLILPFGYAPLIGYSLFQVLQYIRKQRGILFSRIFVYVSIAVLVIIAFPLINKWVFTGTSSPTDNLKIGYYAQIPNYYELANSWLNQDTNQFRVIALPIDGEGMTYTWRYGYNGVEVSNGLFDKPFISFSQTNQFLDNIVHQLQYSLFQTPQYFSKIMSLLNAKYIMTRFDVDYKARTMENPLVIDSYIASNSGKLLSQIQLTKDYGYLKFYENKNVLPVIYAASVFNIAPSKVLYSDVMTLSDFKQGDIIVNSDPGLPTKEYLDTSKTALVTPDSVIFLNQASMPNVTLIDAKQQEFHPHTLPSSPLYPFIRLKENIEAYFDTDSGSQFFKYVLLTNKRLGEFISEVESNSMIYSQKTNTNYIGSLNALSKYQESQVLTDNIYYLRSTLIAERLLLQDLLTRTNPNLGNLVEKALISLNAFSQRNSVEPEFNPITNPGKQNSDKVVYNYTIPKDGTYEVLIKNQGVLFSSTSANTNVQIDNRLFPAKIEENNGWTSFGKYALHSGKHEIQVPIEKSENLIENSDDVVTISSSSNKAKIFTIPTYALDPYGEYRVTFDFWVQKGNGAKVGFGSNIENKKALGSYKHFGPDGYSNDFQTRSFNFSPNPSASSFYISFLVEPYNDCVLINSSNPFSRGQCLTDKNYSNQFGKPTVLQIKNIRLEKVFTTDQAVLLESNTVLPNTTIPQIFFQKKNKSEYIVNVRNASGPFFLVLSESFHPLWQAKFIDNSHVLSKHVLANSYANAWYVNRQGSYSIQLLFSPESYLNLGRIITFGSIVICILTSVIVWYRKKHE